MSSFHINQMINDKEQDDVLSETVSLSCHLLENEWTYYSHLPKNKNWNLQSYTVICNDINNVELVNALNKSINENIVKGFMLFVMKKGISPMWEDDKNKNGRVFKFLVMNKNIYDVWKQLICCLCGGSLCVNPEHNSYITGVSISPKRHFCILKIWVSSEELNNTNIFIDIPNLPKEGCIFTKHGGDF